VTVVALISVIFIPGLSIDVFHYPLSICHYPLKKIDLNLQ